MPRLVARTPTATELATRIAVGELSPVDVVTEAVERALAVQPALNCFTDVWADEALAMAKRAADAVERGEDLGLLHGVPVAVKDTTAVAGHRTTLGSYAFEHWVPEHDAYVVKALRRAGAVIIGHTTTPEFAHTLVTDSPLWGVTRNPHDPSRTPGGSSGGSAAAVASGCVPVAEGSDMGGSVRIPAAWCGIVGLKPSLGRIPMDVLPGLFDSISHHGPLAGSVADARLFLAATQGPDDADVLSIPGPLDLAATRRIEPRELHVAFTIDLGCWAVDAEIEAAVRGAVELLANAGATVHEVDPGLTAEFEQAWLLYWEVFMATYYGHLVERFGAQMDPQVLGLIDAGLRRSAVDLKSVELVRTDLWRRLRPILEEHDVLVCPTMAQPPWPAAKSDTPQPVSADDGRYHSPDMTAVFNLVSPCPVLSVPVGRHADGLPIGMQVVGRRWRDDVVLAVGHLVDQLVPPVSSPP